MSKAFSRGIKAAVAAIAITTQLAPPAAAFCGFYVAKADASLFNKASKVVLAWEDGKTAVTMASDYEGDPKEFAVVIPVPNVLERKDISIVEMKTVDHLDAYTAPRLVEYFDADPCVKLQYESLARLKAPIAAAAGSVATRALSGVTVEASYAVGEYDIQILSASQSDGLVSYLLENGYRIPAGADDVLASYIKEKMHFFIAKVNLGRMEESGHRFLRPLQVRCESRKFMLPLRLGTVNANGPQDLIVRALTHKGRVETTNYRTVKLPTGMDVPLLREGRVRQVLHGDVRPGGGAAGSARRVPGIRLGHGLVRPLRRSATTSSRHWAHAGSAAVAAASPVVPTPW